MSQPEDFVAKTCPEAHLQGVCKELRAEIERLRMALTFIASFREGPVVNSSFDEPESAKIARAALGPLAE